MNKKDILELKKRFKKNNCTFTKMFNIGGKMKFDVLTLFPEMFNSLKERVFSFVEACFNDKK